MARIIEGPMVVVCNECIDHMHSMIHKPPMGEVFRLRRNLRVVGGNGQSQSE